MSNKKEKYEQFEKLKGLPKFKIDNADFIKLVKESFSIREVLIKCRLHPVGGNYRVFKQKHTAGKIKINQ